MINWSSEEKEVELGQSRVIYNNSRTLKPVRKSPERVAKEYVLKNFEEARAEEK